ncbi:type II toxin-antitoxin system VapC family toxin [Bellilinea sp.]|uniref:type II toxin-antitoxin system VapC family toxin n=1 Tax=Bellilinea sp. TaxID=2838785 RepID=UPI0021DECF53|nr:type II toxin-antitoxin system VapC family toxin [Bellilinea sp.]GIV64813.1 MAG: hypothetical protein KatS3mg046_073 [Bellilinea sp.]
MAVVIDANLTLALFLSLPYTEQAYRLMDHLRERQSVLSAPLLWEYECLKGFHRAVRLGVLRPQDAVEYMYDLLALEIERVAPTVEIHQAALRWAERLGQSKAYDAQYVALAEQLKAELWSADQRLIQSLKEQGISWAHWIGEEFQ